MKTTDAAISRRLIATIVAVALIGATSFNLVQLCFCSPTSSSEAADETTVIRPALFDYNQFKVLFDKHYELPLELMAHRVHFLANAFKVWVSGVAYKFWRSSSYLALNELSDYTPQQLAMMRNRRRNFERDLNPSERVNRNETEVEFVSTTAANELEHKIDNSLIGLAQIESSLKLDYDDDDQDGDQDRGRGKRQRREKREAHSKRRRRRAPRKFSMERLIQMDRPDLKPEPAHVVAKLDLEPESNNPNYDPLGMELDTMGLIDQQRPIKMRKLKLVVGDLEPESLISNAKRISMPADDETGELGDGQSSDELADEMFVDLRETGCMFKPRQQGLCGSCYAFAGMTMIEFLFCRSTGSLLAFSEQYMVDCGNERITGMSGCDGAVDRAVPEFVHNFGLELLEHYPYSGDDSHCPYANDTDLKTTGFIRMDLKNNMKVPLSSWEEVVKYSPIYIALNAPQDFDQYGGGVVQAKNCEEEGHAMVLVGHGREDGQEFWLIRNSYGTRWGVEGYYKLAKSSPVQCLQKWGRIYGTKNAIKYKVKPRQNELHTELSAD